MTSPAIPGSDRAVSAPARARLPAALVFIALVVAAVSSLGAPLITAVAQDYGVSLAAAQWTLTIALLSGAVATPLVGRLGSDRRLRSVVLATLAVVLAGSVATVLPAPFAVLLIGRAAQGVGLGLTALMMATARQHLGARAPGTIAMLAITSTAGIGVGYPLAGLMADIGGVRAAYLFGMVVVAAALLTALVSIPADARREPREGGTDWLGAGLLCLGLIAVLLVTSETDLWSSAPVIAVLVLAAGVAVLAGWVAVERRSRWPLVDLSALRHPAVARANLVMCVSGIAMYLLLTLITRYVQTPPQAGYGYGLSDFEAGLVLVPFSGLGFVAGRLVSRLRQRAGPFVLLASSTVVLTAAGCVFAATRSAGVAWPIVAMGMLGLAVGGASAAMPQAILAVTPARETAAAMSINQVARSAGFSLGSALSTLVLAAYTDAGRFAPAGEGYTTTAVVGVALAAASVGLAATARRRRDPA